MRSTKVGLGLVAAAVLVAVACGSNGGPPDVSTSSTSSGAGGSGGGNGEGNGGGQQGGGTDAGGGGTADAGTDGGTTDAGTTDGGTTDAGTTDGGTTDGGPTDGGVGSITVPNAQGWTFYTAADGMTSTEAMGVSADEGGNLWVAGGVSGVYVQRAGTKSFQQYGLADGLHPYGYMPDGGPADTNPYLEAVSIAGGPAGTAFVGYMGKPVPAGVKDCESNWDDGAPPDPAIYKSGDADKVTLNGNGINVVHYDIFSGPGRVPNEPRGREKLCNVLRIKYEHGSRHVWFGANHGFALGFADFGGNPTCNGQLGCTGVWEHVHPAINGWNDSGTTVVYLTGDYRGVDVDPLTHDVWFGGIVRTTLFHFASTGGDFFGQAELKTESINDWSDRFDVWPDLVGEPNIPHKADRIDDNVWGIAAMPDGTAWIGSRNLGLRRINSSGVVVDDATSKLVDRHLTALARDPGDDSVWIGYPGGYGLGLSQLMPDGSMRHYNKALGESVSNLAVTDIQVDTSSNPHRVLVSFCTQDPAFLAPCAKNGVSAIGVYQPK